MHSCRCRCNKVLLGGKSLQNFARFRRFKTSLENMLKFNWKKVLKIKKFVWAESFFRPSLPLSPSLPPLPRGPESLSAPAQASAEPTRLPLQPAVAQLLLKCGPAETESKPRIEPRSHRLAFFLLPTPDAKLSFVVVVSNRSHPAH